MSRFMSLGHTNKSNDRRLKETSRDSDIELWMAVEDLEDPRLSQQDVDELEQNPDLGRSSSVTFQIV